MERPRALGYQGVDRRAETGAWFKNSQQPGRSWGSLSPSIRRKSCRVFLTITTARRVDARSWDDAKSLQRPLPGRCHSRAGPTRMTSRLSEFGPAQFIVLLLKFADRCSRFVNNLAGLLVGAKSEIYRVAHLACRRPFGELYFSHQCRLDPGGDGFVLHPRGKRRLCDLERQKLAVKFFKDLVGETRADMAYITPGVLVAQGKNQRAEELARLSGCGKTRNDGFLTLRCLDLQATMRNPSYLSSKTQPVSSNGRSEKLISGSRSSAADSEIIPSNGLSGARGN